MEETFAPSYHRSISACNKQIKNPSTRGFIHGGFFLASPPPLPPSHALSFSYPPSSYSMLYPNQLPNYHQRQSQQPPLLPLPTSSKSHSSRAGDLAFSPSTTTNITRKTSRNKDQSLLTTKKSKQPVARREDPKLDSKTPTKSFIISSTVVPLGPDPNNLPKNASKFLSVSPPSSTGNGVILNITSTPAVEEYLEKFTGSVYSISPPPSSLPLPKFSVRPKVLSCTAEAAGIDAGATDNLRRILRLR